MKTRYCVIMQCVDDYLFFSPLSVSCVGTFLDLLREQMVAWVQTLQLEDPSTRPGVEQGLFCIVKPPFGYVAVTALVRSRYILVSWGRGYSFCT